MTFIGGVILQWPLGSLSDRINRRTVVLLSSLGSMAMAGLIAFLLTQPHPSYALMLLAAFFYGGFCYPIYTLLIALLNDRLEPSMFTRASRALLSLSGFGAIIGPLCGSLCLNWLGHSGGFAFITLVFAGLALICLQRMVFGKKLPAPKKLT
jgi:MFS family permease